MMTPLYLGLGSNVRPAHFLPVGLAALERLLGPLRRSEIYRGAAMGFKGDPFWNLVVLAHTTLSVGDLQGALRDIEYANGRPRQPLRDMSRTLDIDILLYGDAVGVFDGVELPRDEILCHAFVLRPLAELAPDAVHPVTGDTYFELWRRFDQASQPLDLVEL